MTNRPLSDKPPAEIGEMRKPLFGVEKKIIAYQLSMLGDAPKPCHNWRRPYYTIRFFGGENFPPMDDEIRQNIMLRADSMSSIPSTTETAK